MLGMHYDLGPKNPVDSPLPLRLTTHRLPARNLLTIAVLNASMCLSTWANEENELLEIPVAPWPDWQPVTVIPIANQTLRCRQCQGQFVDPFASADQLVAPTEADLEVTADDSEVTETTLFFKGNATMTLLCSRAIAAKLRCIPRINF